MDTTDQRLIAILRQDARTPVSALAHDLNLSRATVRARMERLHQNGTIRRFTVELDPVQEADLVRAVVMIRVEGSHTRSVIRAFARMPQIVAQYATNGVWDLVIDLECANLQDFDRALREVREVRGVTGSESSLLLRSLTDS